MTRLWDRVKVGRPNNCWPWLGPVNNYGYGVFDVSRSQAGPRTTTSAHRAAYEATYGPVESGLHVDHLCRNRLCCNPAHLEPVTPGENKRRAMLFKTQCVNGHEYTPENTYLNPAGFRVCKTCRRIANAKYNRKRRRDNAGSTCYVKLDGAA